VQTIEDVMDKIQPLPMKALGALALNWHAVQSLKVFACC